ncbi:MAG: iron-sulfur cluster repair di-iron protein [Gammaproteobacteria bacterium]|nr:iron-sulfur cluster repair di-iron protein [Gammaproteobacteria bacterium]
MPQPSVPSGPPYATRSLGELARDIPGATTVFRRHHLDFCCGGETTLEVAAKEQHIDVESVVRELVPLDVGRPDDTPHDPISLTNYIIVHFHDVHRRELPELIALSATVEQVHAGHVDLPAGLSNLLQTVMDELTAHMHKEEQVLFPMMRSNPGRFLAPPIARMRAEHVDHGRMLQEIRDRTRELQLPSDACNTWRALYAGLDRFITDFMQHVHTENNILFPQFEGRA